MQFKQAGKVGAKSKDIKGDQMSENSKNQTHKTSFETLSKNPNDQTVAQGVR